MMENRFSRSLVITGHVQGVGYRAWLMRTARNLGLRGYVCNQPDGSVYAEATGSPQALDQLEQLCWMGPAEAVVKQVLSTPIETRHIEDFHIRR
ncbi:MAG: acylphosphatase [Flavobacteriales bacterium]|nr:acylphosphatase [Flavobacteriales bacterium]MDW8431199.1 acylphosphatase [Flavobacteriales bacterium]